jgi:hypothetical protein
MKRTIEFHASVEIEVTNPDDMAEAIHAARCKLGRVHEVSPDWSITVPIVCQLTTEQSRAVRVVTATAKNGGSVPQTMEDVADGAKPILGAPQRQGGESWFVADSAGR